LSLKVVPGVNSLKTARGKAKPVARDSAGANGVMRAKTWTREAQSCRRGAKH
jgi:hypothetical protein